MKQAFQYSVLKYRPSYLLDERINIGLLFHFSYINNNKRESKLVFVYPSKLSRISKTFPHIGQGNLTNIRRYLLDFSNQANKLNKEAYRGTTLKEILPSEFLVKDANSLFFSDIKDGYYESKKDIIEYYKNQYFKYYDESTSRKTQDTLVKDYFTNSLKALSGDKDGRLKYFKEGILIENKITTSKFEYKWLNGTTNLIKTLGFDLSDKQDIQDKAFKWTSAINYINELGQYRDYHFDILVSKPSNNHLFSSYDIALDILNDIKANKQIVEHENIKNYAAKALETVKPS